MNLEEATVKALNEDVQGDFNNGEYRAVRIVEKNPESAPTTETKKKNLFDKLIKK